MITVTLDLDELQFLLRFVEGLTDSLVAEQMECSREKAAIERRLVYTKLKDSEPG